MPNSSPNIYEYHDYHKFLLDYYEWRKNRHSYFSYRYISQKTGIDHGLLIKIFQGRRQISVKNISKLIDLLELNKRNAEYFELLVYYGRAKTDKEIKRCFDQLLAFSDVSAKTIKRENYEYFQKWYYAAVRETLNFVPFKGDYAGLAGLIEPAILPGQAKKAINLLKNLELIRLNSQGVYELTDQFITSEEEWFSIAVKSFQRQQLDMAKNALDNISKERRNISTVSVSMGKESLDQIAERVKQFHTDLLKIAEASKSVDRAYQINIQVFPLSKPYKGAGL